MFKLCCSALVSLCLVVPLQSRCVSTFSRELKNLLRNMTTRNMTTNNKYNIQLLKLEGNLSELEKDQTVNTYKAKLKREMLRSSRCNSHHLSFPEWWSMHNGSAEDIWQKLLLDKQIHKFPQEPQQSLQHRSVQCLSCVPNTFGHENVFHFCLNLTRKVLIIDLFSVFISIYLVLLFIYWPVCLF